MKNWIIKNKALALVIVLAIIGLIVLIVNNMGGSKDLAKCIKNSGAKFYGSSTCPHCKSEKARFGSSASDLPYVECEGPSRSKLCADNNITVYPTWIFADGTRQQGDLSLDMLAKKTGCSTK